MWDAEFPHDFYVYISHQTDIEIYVWFERFIYNLKDSYIQLRKMHVSKDNLDILFTLLNEGSTDLQSHF